MLTDSLADALTTAVNVFTFKEKTKIAKSNKTWFDKDGKKSMIRQNFAFNKYTDRTPSIKTKYPKMRNSVCELLRSNKREHINDRLTRFLNLPKRFINELNQLTGRQKNCNFIILNNENKLNTDDLAGSNLFNERFDSITKILAASIPTVPFTTEELGNSKKSLFFYPTDSLEISKFVRNLKNQKAAELDGLTAEILKVSLDVICDRLTHLVNESLSSGVFPKILKTAKVVPIFISGKKSSCKNYRPISTLSVLSKVFERIVFERLYKFMQVNNLFYCHQYGFRSKMSTLQAVADIPELIRNNIMLMYPVCY